MSNKKISFAEIKKYLETKGLTISKKKKIIIKQKIILMFC